MYEIDNKKVYEVSSEFLRTFINYWNKLPPEKKSGYFCGDNIIAMKELSFSRIPVQLRLRIIRFDLNLPVKVAAEVASQGIKISITPFSLMEDLEYNEKNITQLVEAYITASKELYYEIRDYI